MTGAMTGATTGAMTGAMTGTMTGATTCVAVFGGSFDPPHIAHQMACLLVLETCAVDALWMVPTYRHPFDKPLAPFVHRLAMCELAAAPLGERVRVSAVERDLGGEHSHTLDTLVELGRRHPDTALRLVVGADVLAQRDAWHRWEEVTRLAPPIVLARAGHPGEGTVGPALPEVSSTEVRARLGAGASAVPLVSRAVMDYIDRQGLYR